VKGQKVVVATSGDGRTWHYQPVTSGASGVFHSKTVSAAHRRHWVAQWIGNVSFRGAGSKPVRWTPPPAP
jgi:hypothetical protein